MSTTKGKRLQLRLDPKIVQEILQAARRGCLSFNDQLVQIIEDMLAKMEKDETSHPAAP